jgi:hypothetical protein
VTSFSRQRGSLEELLDDSFRIRFLDEYPRPAPKILPALKAKSAEQSWADFRKKALSFLDILS